MLLRRWSEPDYTIELRLSSGPFTVSPVAFGSPCHRFYHICGCKSPRRACPDALLRMVPIRRLLCSYGRCFAGHGLSIRSDPFLGRRSDCQVFKMNFDLLYRTPVSFILHVSFPRRVIQYIISQITLVEGDIVHRTEMTLEFQQNAPFRFSPLTYHVLEFSIAS